MPPVFLQAAWNWKSQSWCCFKTMTRRSLRFTSLGAWAYASLWTISEQATRPLSYLRRFPFDKIKVDQLFVRDLPDEGDAAVIVELIVRLGASLRMITTAEGVETEEQLVRLRAAGCTQAQGFFFAKPKPAQELSYSLKGCPALERAA